MSNGERVRKFAVKIHNLFNDEPLHIIGASVSMFLCALSISNGIDKEVLLKLIGESFDNVKRDWDYVNSKRGVLN